MEGDSAKRATDGAWARSVLVFVVAEQQGLDGVIATEVEEGCILLRSNKTFLLCMYFYITLHCSRLLPIHTTLKTPGSYHPLLSSLTRTHSPTESAFLFLFPFINSQSL